MLAIARLGVADSLRPGITTTADYSFSGASATAAAELGLRAIVYLEVFAERPEDARAAVRGEARARRGDAARADRRLAARAVHLLARHLPLVPVARHPGRHASRGERERERVARARHAARSPGSPILVPPTGKRAVASLEPVLGPDLLCAHCVEVARARSRCSPSAASPSRTARARTRSSAAASRRSPSCGRQASVVGLGTDSPASTPSFDIFEEMRTAIYAARARERRPEALLADGRTAAGDARCGPRPATRATRWVP